MDDEYNDTKMKVTNHLHVENVDPNPVPARPRRDYVDAVLSALGNKNFALSCMKLFKL